MSGRKICLAVSICVALTVLTVSVAEGQGVRRKPETQEAISSSLPTLEVAVVELEPGYSLTDQKSMEDMVKQNAYPKVRNAETVYFSSKIKEAIQGLRRVTDAFIVPTRDVYADLYFTGRIRKSTGEHLEIVWNLHDATGKYWLTKKVSKLRLADGWDRFFTLGMDPFDSVYTDIAGQISKELQRKARDHDKRVTENEKLMQDNEKRRTEYEERLRNNEELIAQGQRPKRVREPKYKKLKDLSELQKVTMLRDLMLAGYFDAGNYYDYVKERRTRNGQVYEVALLPNKQEPSWQRVEQVSAAYQGFVGQLSGSYENYAQQIGEVYGEYIRAMYPLAREFRKAEEKRSLLWGLAIIGGLVVLADGSFDTDQWPELAAAVAAVAAATSAINENKDINRSRLLIEEVATGFETQFVPLTVALGEEQQLVLEGRPKEQLDRFVQILAAEAQKRDQEIPEITVVGL